MTPSNLTMKRKKQNPKKTLYYRDLLKDDFAGTNIKTEHLDENFKYIHRNIFWRIASFLIYYVVAIPVLFFTCKFALGVKIVNRKAIKKVRKQGYFIYGNHTQIMDAFISQVLITRPKKTFIIANPDAVSIPGIRALVMMLGCLPLPSTVGGTRKFLDAIKYHIKHKHAITVFPEAHIWPYATLIRPFTSSSFRYPANLNAPVVPIVTTYEKRKIFKHCLKPRMVITIGEPLYPNTRLGLKEAMEDLRKKTFAFMVSHASKPNNVEYYRYEKEKDDNQTSQGK
ncbi:MAG: lysophospholipid acyltransferase family protein [Bacilli bacterium]|nr:lysophospholipid acyltransferase family protein [Bacilli bacterium]MDD4006223.1 lysophospholipid acyltransferase family protein [Bacilli bacterium]